MSIELMLLSVNINFVAFSAFLQDLTGQIFAIFVLTVAGAEAAIGLAILVIYFYNHQNIETRKISAMRGWLLLLTDDSAHFHLVLRPASAEADQMKVGTIPRKE